MDNMNGYRRAMDNIHPSGKLLEETRAKMNAQMSFESRKNKRRGWLFAIPAAALAAAALIFALLLPARRLSGFSADGLLIEPTSQQNGVVGVDTGFLITSATGSLPGESALKELITITPETDFELERQDGGYLLTTGEDFDEGSLIRLTVSSGEGEKRWAFQTGETFRVKSHFPAAGAEYVDCDTGIEIELTSAGVTVENFDAAFSITPETGGRIVKNGSVFVFIPDEPLLSMTRYTVRIDGSLSSDSGDALGQNVSFSFTTTQYVDASGEPGRIANSRCVSESYLPEDTPVIEYYAVGDVSDSGVRVEVWRYADADGYKQALSDYLSAESSGEAPELQTGGLEAAVSFETDTNINGEYAYMSRYAVFPEELDSGWYVAELTADNGYGGECSLTKFIQVSDVSVYALETDDNSVFWLNDAGSGKPLENAAITLEREGGTAYGVTNSDGVAYLEQPDGETDGLIDIDSDAGRYISLWSFASGENSMGERYYSYLYCDRPVYQPDDTVSFWGIVRPRNGEALPESVRITLGDWNNTLFAQEVPLDSDGSFCGELSFEGLDGWLTLSVEIGGEVVYSRGIEVYSYDKPVYSIDLATDKNAYFEGEDAVLSINVSFFDGTPAQNVELEAFVDGRSAALFTTDEYGNAEVTVNIPEGSSESWTPCMILISVCVSGTEDVLTEAGVWCHTFARDTALYGVYSAENGRLDVYTDAVDPSGTIDGTSLYEDNYAAIRGDAVEKKVYGYLYRVWYTKTTTGSYYDFAQKKTVKSYEYIQHEQKIKTYKFETAGGHDYIDGIPEAEEGEYYYIELVSTDSQGRRVRNVLYLTDPVYTYDYRGHNFRFSRVGGSDEYSFADGETVELRLIDNNSPVTDGKLFSVVAASKAEEYSVTGTSVSIPYSESHVPNFMVYGAWFDGKRVYAVAPEYLCIDPSQRGLTVSIDGELESAPGEEIELTVKVTDGEGKPVPDASGVLMLVDEAVFAVQEQEANALTELYREVYFNYGWKTYVSYTDYLAVSYDGGRGGGGGGSVRKNFRDTAGVYRFTTGEDGSASITAVLPDSITSWRATAIAAASSSDGRLLAGDARADVSAGLDFFISHIIPDELIAGDELLVSLKSCGEALQDRVHTVEYTCALKSSRRTSLFEPGADIVFRTSAAAGEYVDFSFGTLAAGEYTVTVTAECGELSDALELPLTVCDSALEAEVVREVSLEDIPSLEPERYPLEICVYRESDRLLGKIYDRFASDTGSRADQRLARAWLSGDAASVADLTASNGISVYPYSDREPLLTAQLLTALGQSFDFCGMSGYFRSVLSDVNSSSGDVAAAYLGLAAEGQPVLADIRSLIRDDRSFTLYDRLILTAALAVLGDDDGAQAYFEELTSGIIVTAKNSDGFDESRVTGLSDEDTLRLTAAASITASLLHNGHEDALAEYLASDSSRPDLTLGALLCYVTHPAPNTASAKLTYTLDGENRTAKLDSENRFLLLSVSREQQSELRLKCSSGEVLASVLYCGDAEELMLQQPPSLVVDKSCSGSGSFTVGDRAEITVDISGYAPDKSDPRGVTVVDCIPSGMRFFRLSEQSSNSGWRLEREEGQRVRFVWYPSDTALSVPPLSYTVVCVSAGSYISESAYARVSGTQPSALWGLSERGSVNIASRKDSAVG